MYLAISVPISVVLSLDPFESSTITNESWYTDPWFFLINVVVDLFFFVDMYLHWNHFAYMHHGLVIRKLRNIRKHYVLGQVERLCTTLRHRILLIQRIMDLSHTTVGGLLKRPLKGRNAQGDASEDKEEKDAARRVYSMGFLLGSVDDCCRSKSSPRPIHWCEIRWSLPYQSYPSHRLPLLLLQFHRDVAAECRER